MVTLLRILRAAWILNPSSQNLHVLAEGNFIVIHSLSDLSPIEPKSEVFDLLRLDETGKKDEHWDIIEPIKKP